VPHIIADGKPVLISFNQGEGTVFVMGSIYPFTNAGLRFSGSQQLIANFMGGTTPQETRIGFDEGQLADITDLPPNIFVWLLSSNAGRGTVLFGVIILIYFLSQGRRFGKPVPLKEDRLRREPVEYIVALANLFRRSGRRTETLQHYKKRLRRRLAERYALDPTLTDHQLAKAAATRTRNLDEAALAALLAKLDEPNVSESNMLVLASEVNQWLNRLGTR
jgi:hypothetical protein